MPSFQTKITLLMLTLPSLLVAIFGLLYLLGLSTIAMGMFGIGQVQSVEYFFLTAPIIGFSGGLLMSNITTWMLSFTDEQNRIKASSYLISALFLGQFFSPVFSYPLVMKLGVQSFFEMLGIGMSLCVVIAVIIIKQMMKMPKKV